MIKNNNCQRTLALTLAAVMLASFASCEQGKNGDSAVSKSDTVAYSEKEDEKYYYPITEEIHYDGDGNPQWRDTYEYSPEGYLLSERTSKYFLVIGYDGGKDALPEYHSSYLYGETDVNTYRYDEAGRLLEEYNGYEYNETDDDDVHYRKHTASYRYDDKGRRISTQEIFRRYVVRDPLKGFGDDNLTEESEDTIRSECVITENDKSGGWKSFETFTFTGYFESDSGETVEMEYDADGRLLSRTKTVPDIECIYTARYGYDEKGRPVSAHIRTHDFDNVEYGYSRVAVEYNEDSHMVRKTVDAAGDSMEDDAWFAFAIQCEYDDLGRLTKRQRSLDGETGCIETVTYSDDGTAVKDHIYPDWSEEKDWLENEEIVYADSDENGNYHTLFKYILKGQDRDFYQKITREYGEAMPSGVKYGTSGILHDEESVSPVQHNFDLGLGNEFLFYDFDETDSLYNTF